MIVIRAKSDFEGAKSDFDLLEQKVILIRAKSNFEGARSDFDLLEQRVILIKAKMILREQK